MNAHDYDFLRLCQKCSSVGTGKPTLGCTKCSRHYHYECVSLPETHKGPWLCADCSTFLESEVGSIASIRSTASARLRLKQLQEAKNLEDKIQLANAERERLYLAEKHRLEAEAEIEQVGGGTSVVVDDLGGRKQDTSDWVTAHQTAGFENPPANGATSTPIGAAAGNISHIVPPLVNRQDYRHNFGQQSGMLGTPTGLPKHLLPPTTTLGILESTLPANQHLSDMVHQQLDLFNTQTMVPYNADGVTYPLPVYSIADVVFQQNSHTQQLSSYSKALHGAEGHGSSRTVIELSTLPLTTEPNPTRSIPSPIPHQPYPPRPISSLSTPPQPITPQPIPPQPIPPQPIPPQPIPPQPIPPQPIPPQSILPQPIPPQPVPPQAIPLQPIPPQSISLQPIPPQPIPPQSILPQPIPPQPISPQPVPPQPVSPQSNPLQPIPPQPIPPQPIPPQAILPQPVPPQPVPPQPVPPQPVPPQPVPPQSIPLQPIPPQPIPSQSILSQSIPSQRIPPQPIPPQPIPPQPIPPQPIPPQPIPPQPILPQPIPPQSIPLQPIPPQTLPPLPAPPMPVPPRPISQPQPVLPLVLPNPPLPIPPPPILQQLYQPLSVLPQPVLAQPVPPPLYSIWNPHTGTYYSVPCPAPSVPQVAEGVISSQQMAARQVVSKELPKFSGDPLEWPMFLSAFESTTAICGIQPDENLSRLQRSLIGRARDMVQSILTLPAAIPEIISILQDECGRPDQLVHCLLSRVRSAPPPNINKLDTLVTFGREVRNLVTYIEAANLETHLSNPMLLMELVMKLPPSLRLDWGLHAQRMQSETLKTFSEYVSSIRTAACHVSLPTELNKTEDLRRGKRNEISGFINAHSNDEKPEQGEVHEKQKLEVKPCVGCKQTDHRIRNCDTFRNLPVADRWMVLEQNGMCQRCLVTHGKWPCRTKQPCGVDGCAEQHHKLLHPGKPKPNPVSSAVVAAHHQQHDSTMFKIIPVTLFGKGKSINVFAFLDDGSNMTLLENGVANELGLLGETRPLLLQWTSNITRKEASSRRVELSVAGDESGKRYQLSNVCTVDKLGLPRQSLCYKSLSEQYPHLQGLPVSSYREANPQILIGLPDARLMLGLKRRERWNGEPVATKTRLGWTIFGGTHVSRAHVTAHACEDDESNLHNIVKQYFDSEDFGIAISPPPEPAEVQRARKLLAETTKRTETGRFETGLLWKSDDVKLPDSFHMAERRMKLLERRLQKDPELKQIVDNQIQEYIERGYAHIATADELEAEPPRVWYLPLGIVRNPRKPDKVRVVWDAAAQVRNVSLNSSLLKGPDLLVSLPSVISRFRQKQFAVAGDVKQMFHQLLIRKEDKQSQRFLYRTNPKTPPAIFVMDVATFGAACSPCSAHYVKNLNASEHRDAFPDAARAIIENTYVDDFLDSRDSIEEAAQLVKDVREVFSKACFEIRNWQSNSDAVLERVGTSSPDAVKRFIAEKSSGAERVLGIKWIPEDDVFVFQLELRNDLTHLLSGETVPTKRQVLRVVMSIFDPLGFITTYTIHGKVLIQDIWRSGIEWDDSISAKDFSMWQRWIKLSSELARVRIPRCYFPNYDPESLKSLELLVFTDASEIAYNATAYFRIIDQGIPRCALVSSKSKVTPLKPQSIPKNESNAAVMGVRLAKSITENHTLPIKRRTFFTDSNCVISWLRADPRKYRQYVAFRIAEILESTTLDEWLWISTRLNVADKGTKWGKSGPEFDPSSEFYRAPEFTHQPREEWPTKNQDVDETEEELRAVFVYHGAMKQPIVNFVEFSCLKELLKRIAQLFRFSRLCQDKHRGEIQSTNLTQGDYTRAERSLWRMVQAEEFPDEVATLLMNADKNSGEPRQLEKASLLYKLSPYLDDDSIVRMDSRISTEMSYFAYDFRNPIILPRDHHVTSLLIHRFHQRYGHANTETVVNELRQKFYIPKLRSQVKKVISRCQWCLVYRATPANPRMAPLPQPRVTPYVRPFSFVGLDYFGPLIVKRGRTNVKRWVALFTCLTVRAVHLEVVHSLSTESCKMAIRRFVARRGAPQQIFSDNGTCFRGSAKELADEVKAINRAIAGTFTNADTEWHFNPPSAPHMGGVWERKVRAVKEGLKVLAHPRRLDDEGLVTLLTEVEMIVNSHPLTFVSLESPVLTPNNFLLMSSSGANAEPRIPVDEITTLRSNWKLMQHLTDQFWKRWIKAYLPTISRRTKWFADVRPLQEGDYVVIVDETVRNGWQRGRVIKSFPALDGQVRKVDVQTDTGVVRRPSIKVALLDIVRDDKTT